MRGLYIHIPFCKQKCHYCHFVSKTDLSLIDSYTDALVEELKSYRSYMNSIVTLYIGGGTPSLLSCSQLEKIVNQIDFEKIEEFTIEVNPESVTEEKLMCYRKLGVNRISMGVQTTDDKQLKLIGRLHNYSDVVEKFKLIRKMGFDNVNLDLIYGLPEQSEQSLQLDIDRIMDLSPEHISTYSLMYEEGTFLDSLRIDGIVKAATDEIDRKFFQLIQKQLEIKNYKRYEISNFSKKGFESNHNLLYWSAKEYIGAGVSAHGYLERYRYENESDIQTYIQRMSEGKSAVVYREFIDDKEEIFEYIMLNLRKSDGFAISEFNNKFNLDFYVEYYNEIDYLVSNNAVSIENGRIFLTNYGFDVSNSVYGKFLR
ncbi:MAG: radical SAM family heme chaperone HemW [Clostridiales bacterium]|nr:radical SAM family heme chaperone HemW [Clostridiales bacterium]